MAKQESQPPATIQAADLREYITSQDDFAFEREVYHRAHGLGLSATHAGLYEDPVTNKPRQFDIRASKTADNLEIHLTIECKGLNTSYPLLVSCVPRVRSESFHQLLYTDETQGVGGSYTRVTTMQSRLYREGQPVGKAMRQIRRDNRGALTGGDEVFDKWMQALASAAELIEGAAEQLSVPSDKPKYATVLPVLVVSDDTLWVADYASNGRLRSDPFSVQEITFFLGRKYELKRERLTFTISHLHIYTRSHVSNFLQEVAGDGGIWPELFKQ
jgi:hypothetical protein